jgi:hypothetical protein
MTVARNVWQPQLRSANESEVAATRRKTHGFKGRCADWDPPPRSFADDADDCIMVPIL